MIPKEFETISEYVCKQTRWTDGSIRHDRMEDVVRCKDCIVFGTHGKNTDICPMWHNTHIDPYRDFCSRGVRKTENSSEKPNNCEDEPTTQTETQNSNLTFEKDECAKEYEELGLKELKELINADRKTEPQTTDYCDVCNHKGCDNCIADGSNPYCVPSHFEPKDEPQTDCAWR